MRVYDVVAEWDDEARVWVATSDDDIPGLVAEAETQEHLVDRLRKLVPELLELNAHLLVRPAELHEFDIHWKQDQRAMYG